MYQERHTVLYAAVDKDAHPHRSLLLFGIVTSSRGGPLRLATQEGNVIFTVMRFIGRLSAHELDARGPCDCVALWEELASFVQQPERRLDVCAMLRAIRRISILYHCLDLVRAEKRLAKDFRQGCTMQSCSRIQG